MANIKVCDRCGAVINPPSSQTVVVVGDYQRYELCCSCSYHLKQFLTKDTNENRFPRGDQ